MANPNQPPYSASRSEETAADNPSVSNKSPVNDDSYGSGSRRAADRFEIFEQVALERLQAGSDTTQPAAFLPLPVRITAITAVGIAGLGVLWSILARVPVQVNGTAALVPRNGLGSLTAASSGVLNWQVSGLSPNSLTSAQQRNNALLRDFWLNEANATTDSINETSSLDGLVRAALAPAQGQAFKLPEALSGTESFDTSSAQPLVSYPAGTVLARIMNPILHQELNSALLTSVPTNSLQQQQERDRLEQASQLGQLRTLQSNQRQAIAAELQERRKLYERYVNLWRRGYLPATTVMEEQSRINALEAQLLSNDSSGLNTSISRRDQVNQAKQTAIANLDTRTRLENQLISYLGKSTVFAPISSNIYTGKNIYVLGKNFKDGASVREGDELISFSYTPPELPQEIPVFLDNASAQQVSEGMSVLVTPKGISRAQFGGIRGRVVEVTKLPLQGDGLLGVLGSRAMANIVQQQVPSPNLVRVELEQAEPRFCKQSRSRRCYRWSSGRLPPHPVRLATLADVQITTTYRRPIEFVMPALRQALGLVVDNK